MFFKTSAQRSLVRVKRDEPCSRSRSSPTSRMVLLMHFSWLKQTAGRLAHTTQTKRKRRHSAPAFETLDRRVMMAVTASIAGGELRVVGDDADNVITISRTAGGTILVNNSAGP